MNNLTHLTNAEIVRLAYAEQDDITSTPLEIELRKRLERLTDYEEVIDVLETSGVSAHAIDRLLEAIDFLLDGELSASASVEKAAGVIGDIADTLASNDVPADDLLKVVKAGAAAHANQSAHRELAEDFN